MDAALALLTLDDTSGVVAPRPDGGYRLLKTGPITSAHTRTDHRHNLLSRLVLAQLRALLHVHDAARGIYFFPVSAYGGLSRAIGDALDHPRCQGRCPHVCLPAVLIQLLCFCTPRENDGPGTVVRL